MIEITSFLLKHLYELMADNYNARHADQQSDGRLSGRLSGQPEVTDNPARSQEQKSDDNHNCTHQSHRQSAGGSSSSSRRASREQETNQQIVSFLANNHLPDLICETFIELLFICVFLAVSWIFVMMIQLHCHQLQQPARYFYCNTKFLASLMYCNNKSHYSAS